MENSKSNLRFNFYNKDFTELNLNLLYYFNPETKEILKLDKISSIEELEKSTILVSTVMTDDNKKPIIEGSIIKFMVQDEYNFASKVIVGVVSLAIEDNLEWVIYFPHKHQYKIKVPFTSVIKGCWGESVKIIGHEFLLEKPLKEFLQEEEDKEDDYLKALNLLDKLLYQDENNDFMPINKTENMQIIPKGEEYDGLSFKESWTKWETEAYHLLHEYWEARMTDPDSYFDID